MMNRLSGKGTSKTPKAPTLRFRPSWFLREKKTGQLYCIIFAYRVVQEPHVWHFYLEERRDFSPPDTTLSFGCELLGGQVRVASNQSVAYEPFRSHNYALYHFSPMFYKHANGRMTSNKTLLNDFEIASSGEITSV